MNKFEELILSGFGGQGLMFLGKLLAEAAVKEGKFTTWFPAYGAEVRGGTAHCAVIISDKEIASPLVEHPTVLIAMNQPSLNKFGPKVAKDGIILLNKTLINSSIIRNDVKIIEGEFTDIASELGEIRIANMVALGALIKLTNIVNLDSVFAVLEEIIPPSRKFIMAANKKAIEAGRKLIK